jgi:hypothetical protein
MNQGCDECDCFAGIFYLNDLYYPKGCEEIKNNRNTFNCRQAAEVQHLVDIIAGYQHVEVERRVTGEIVAQSLNTAAFLNVFIPGDRTGDGIAGYVATQQQAKRQSQRQPDQQHGPIFVFSQKGQQFICISLHSIHTLAVGSNENIMASGLYFKNDRIEKHASDTPTESA